MRTALIAAQPVAPPLANISFKSMLCQWQDEKVLIFEKSGLIDMEVGNFHANSEMGERHGSCIFNFDANVLAWSTHHTTRPQGDMPWSGHYHSRTLCHRPMKSHDCGHSSHDERLRHCDVRSVFHTLRVVLGAPNIPLGVGHYIGIGHAYRLCCTT